MLAGSYRRFHPKMQLNDALIESYRFYGWGYVLNHPVHEEKGECVKAIFRLYIALSNFTSDKGVTGR